MAEHHDNSKPATNGTISINSHGVFSYFPIEQSKQLMPFYALFIHEKPDGAICASMDIRHMLSEPYDE